MTLLKKIPHNRRGGANDTAVVCEFQTENDFQIGYGVVYSRFSAKLLGFFIPACTCIAC